MNTFYQECIIHVHVYLKVHWIQAVLKYISILFYYSWIIFYQTVKDLFIFFFIQYLLHIHRTVLCKSTYCIHVHVFKKHNTCICITLHSSMLTGNGSHQHSLSEMGKKIWALNTKEKMIEQRALTGNIN